MHANFRPARQAWLGAIALLHFAALMAWRPAAHHVDEVTAGAAGELVFLAPPPARRSAGQDRSPQPARHARQAPAERPAPPPVASDTVRPDAPPAASEASPQTITLPARSSQDADPFARPAAQEETLLAKARKSAAGIDRQLRKESLNKFATIVNEDTALGLAISGGPAPKLSEPESYTGANGIVHKRYMLRGKVVCEEVDHIGTGGHDPFRSGSKARLVQCPR